MPATVTGIVLHKTQHGMASFGDNCLFVTFLCLYVFMSIHFLLLLLLCNSLVIMPFFTQVTGGIMAAWVTAFINTKGGVGKTTLTLEVATAMALAGNRVLVIDADPETGATKWQSDREDKPLFSVVGMATSKLHREIPAHAVNFDHILIDAPPQNDSISKSALMAAECALIPVTPSMHDLRRTEAFLTTVEDAQITNSLLKVAFVLNQRIVNTAIGRDVLGFLGNFPFPILETVVHSRVVFAEASAGRSVLEIAPTSLAAHEILSLTRELLEMLKHDKENRSRQKAASQS